MGRKTEEEEPTRAKRQKKSKAAIVESDGQLPYASLFVMLCGFYLKL